MHQSRGRVSEGHGQSRILCRVGEHPIQPQTVWGAHRGSYRKPPRLSTENPTLGGEACGMR